jgi:hypothetical protein
MHLAQCAGHLEFDDDLVIDYQVGGLFADSHVVVKDHDSPSLHDAEPGLRISWARAFRRPFQ